MATTLSRAETSTANAMWTLISQADANVQRELYIRLRDKHEGTQRHAERKQAGIDYVKSLAVGKGKVPAWEDGKGVLVDVKHDA